MPSPELARSVAEDDAAKRRGYRLVPAIEPKPLPDGGHIRVVSVAGRVDRSLFDRGVDRIEARGFRVSFNAERLDSGHPYLAADDAARAEELTAALCDSDVDAVLCARGGYGSMRVLDKIDFDAAARSAKPFAGFSDNTALHLALNRAGLATYHAPVVTALGKGHPDNARLGLDRLITALKGCMPKTEVLEGDAGGVNGFARGSLVGGNLSLLAACLPVCATSIPRGCILLIEEVAEPLYRIDRMLTGLKLSGLLDDVAGVALGSFSNCGSGPDGPSEAAQVACSCLKDLGVPMVSNLPIGHRDDDLTVPLGRSAVVDGGRGLLTLSWHSRRLG